MKDISNIVINKNRGWRGLAEITGYDKEGKTVCNSIFSYSEDMWRDLMKGYIVLQDVDHYYILHINNVNHLPQHSQRSVTITNFSAEVVNTNTYEKSNYITRCTGEEYYYIAHFRKNTNAHTTSDFNYVGIRVTPLI